jgi:tRNA nucleotidyltransferase (CCA-adding enzyme)
MKLRTIIPQLLEAQGTQGMKIYLVGGAVRDKLMGMDPKDLDYVVVGSTPEEMEERGFTRVGADFPVFLDKKGDEYALARTERKTGTGYKGFDTSFDPTTTLKDDLSRRDLTINAMAEDPETGKVIDPYGGQKDLKAKVIRHVSDAFAEDPLRVLRAARFAARYNFTVAPATKKLMAGLVKSGELSTLTTERVWKEASRAMMEKHPHRFAEVMGEAGALEIVFGELGIVMDEAYHVLRTLAKHNANERQRWMGASLKAGSSVVDAFIEKNKVPSDVGDAMRFAKKIDTTDFSDIDSIMRLLKNTRAWSNQQLFDEYQQMVDWVNPSNNLNLGGLIQAIKQGSQIGFDDLSDDEKANLKGPEIGKAIDAKRRELISNI